MSCERPTALRTATIRLAASGLSVALLACGGGQDIPGPGSRTPHTLEVIAGNGQSGRPGRPLANPVAVQVTDEAGDGVVGVDVAFDADEGDGGFDPGVASTDADGIARATWTIGPMSGAETATASVEGLPPASLSATSLVAPPSTIVPITGSGQEAPAGGEVATAPIVEVRDDDGNAVAGIDVVFEAVNGAVSPSQVTTGSDGRAAPLSWILSTKSGEDTLRATSSSIPGSSVVFVATALPGPVSRSRSIIWVPSGAKLLGDTTVVRVEAKDDYENPIPGAAVHLSATGAGHTLTQPVGGTGPDGSASGRIVSDDVGSIVLSADVEGVNLDQTLTMTVSYGEATLLGRTYCTIGGVSPVMDVYVPDNTHPRPLPVAIHVHGGGYTSGSRSTGFWFSDIANELLDRGYLVVSLDYRLAPAHKYPAQIEDVKCAVRRLRADADRYGLDPARVGVWGSSAGAQLVGLMGTTSGHSTFDDAGGFHDQSSEVQAVIALSAITDLTRTAELNDNYSAEFPSWPNPTSPELIEASPASHVSPDASPFLFIAGADDELVSPEQSQRMNDLLHADGVASSVVLVSHADHGLMPTDGPISPAKTTIIARMADFFDAHLR